MTDQEERAERAQRLASVIEADVIVATVRDSLTRAARAIESALGTNHDTARAVRALADQAHAAAHKLAIVRGRTPWP